MPSELGPVLPDAEHFAQAVGIVSPEATKMPHGPDPKPYIEAVETYRNAGFEFAREIIPGI